MPSPTRLTLLCAASMVMLGLAGAAVADLAPAGDNRANAEDASGAQRASENRAPAGESNVRRAPRPQFERPAGCPYRDGKLELIV